jgi:D-alanyl-D-alanine carboxypeptidase
MGWVRFGGRIGLLFLGLAAVASLAFKSDAADRRHRDVRVQNVHHSSVAHSRARGTSSAAAPAAVRLAQLEGVPSTIIVAAPEPGAVVTSTETASTAAHAAKPEPVGAEQAIQQQLHAPGRWLIQIGAFDSEAEAKQHLSEVQRQASTVLGAADPFTEGVQRGDKLLFRARFAGFDKESAEIACKELKRGHFECMALKN